MVPTSKLHVQEFKNIVYSHPQEWMSWFGPFAWSLHFYQNVGSSPLGCRKWKRTFSPSDMTLETSVLLDDEDPTSLGKWFPPAELKKQAMIRSPPEPFLPIKKKNIIYSKRIINTMIICIEVLNFISTHGT